jgi:hypothetical protein
VKITLLGLLDELTVIYILCTYIYTHTYIYIYLMDLNSEAGKIQNFVFSQKETNKPFAFCQFNKQVYCINSFETHITSCLEAAYIHQHEAHLGRTSS